jgi:hypothetical protein
MWDIRMKEKQKKEMERRDADMNLDHALARQDQLLE